MKYDSPDFINSVFLDVKGEILSELKKNPEGETPIAFILGGQGASGKSDLISTIDFLYKDKSFLIINGDEYRALHPNSKELMAENIDSYSKITQPYSNIFTENLIKEAINNRYNVIIEGTMRNPQTPYNTAKLLRDNEFEVHAAVIAANPKITEISLYCRYINEVNNNGSGRLADIKSHNEAALNLCNSIDYLYNAKIVDAVHVYKPFPLKEIFVASLKNGEWDKTQTPSSVINTERKRQLNDSALLQNRIYESKRLAASATPDIKAKMDSVINELNVFLKSQNKYETLPTYKEFREKISILQVAEHLGYKPVKGKTTSFRPVLRDANGDTILIKNPTIPGKQLYQNLGSDEKGSVIDFVKNRISQFSQFGPFRNETDGINKTLLHFSGLSYNYDAYLHQNGLKEAKPFNIDNFPFCDASLDKLRYLTVERAMNPSTVNDFLPFVKLVTNGGYMNIGFPYSVPGKDDTIKGWELRNYGFKSFSAGGDKINSTWRASFAADKSIVNNVYVFESALDAMSFYELNKTKLELSSAVLASTGGNPGLNQLLNLKNEYPAAKFHACFDNDRAGHLDDITLSCVCDHVSCTKIKTGDFVKFSVSNVEPFTLAGQDITLKNFEKKSGKCSSVDSIKPGMGKDWNEMLQLSKKKELNPEKKPTKFKR